MTSLCPRNRIWTMRSVLVVVCSLGACQPHAATTADPTPHEPSAPNTGASTPPSTDASASPAPNEPSAPSAEPSAEPSADEPQDDLVGLLYITKGHQPMIADHLLRSEEMEARFGDDWRELEGSRFWAKGQLRVHRCEPMAQCLVGGSIPLLENITAIDLCLGCGFYPEGVLPVECPVSDDEAASCKEICRTRSRSCDQGAKDDRGRKRRCGGQRAGCFSDCDRVGVPCH